MSPNRAVSLISTEAAAARGAWLAMLKERLEHFGREGYLAVWAIRPVFDLAIAGLIYAAGNRDVIPYLVVAMTANALVWNSIFWVGEILDRERMKGTLLPLFLAPCTRLSWLLGFAAAGLIETTVAAATVALAGVLLFDVRFHPNLLTLAVVVPLFVASLVGLGLIMSGFGLLTKKSNELANLVFPVITLLGGVYYPVDRLPDLLRIPARLLPVGYGMEALAAAALDSASLSSVSSALIPLIGFALVLPATGALIFRRIDYLARERGDLDFS